MSTNPRDFIAEYVDPSIEMYRTNRTITHLAVHAITQLDNIAEVITIYTQLGTRPYLPAGVATQYRRDVRAREPVLGIITDAHDSHKHGILKRHITNQQPQGASGGNRPIAALRRGFFVGITRLNRPLTQYQVLVITLNDGSQEEVFNLLYRAREAWNRELSLLNI